MADALPLSPYRVLDLSDEKGMLCGRILGDLGADLIKIEPPGGDAARRHGPYFHDGVDPEKSLYWFALNTNKRGITLDIARDDGKALLLRLAAKADFLIESFPPGHMDRLGLGFDTLSKLNPRLVMTSITPFGEAGPYRDFQGDDLVAMAMGGLMAICGDADREPLRIGAPSAYDLGASHAAAGTMLAHYQRLRTGKGRRVEVSIHEAVVNILLTAQQTWYLEKKSPRRGNREYGGRLTRDLYPVKDGFVNFQMFWGPGPGNRMKTMARWMEDVGYDCTFRTVDFNKVTGYQLKQEDVDRWQGEIARFFMRFTKAEVYEQALKRRAFLFPVSSPSDLAGNAQLQARGYWQEVVHPELGAEITYPRAFCHFSETPISVRRKPPLIGEHNAEVYEQELGLSRDEMRTLKEARVI